MLLRLLPPILATFSLISSVFVFAQTHPFSVAPFVEITGGLSNAGIRLGYSFLPTLAVHVEIRDRQVGFIGLSTPCLLLDPDKYTQLRLLDPDRERIALLPTLGGNAPVALAVSASFPRRFTPFVMLRSEIVRFDFAATTILQVPRGGYGSWEDVKSARNATTVHRIAGGAQLGLLLNGKRQRVAYRLYLTVDAYHSRDISLAVSVPNYPELAPINVNLVDHFGGARWGVGTAVQYSFGRAQLRKEAARD